MEQGPDEPTLVVGQLNIYWGMNLAAALAYLQTRPQLDLLCLQEAYEGDIPEIADVLGLRPDYAFAPMGIHAPIKDAGLYRGGTTGIAILSKEELQNTKIDDLGMFYDDIDWEWWKEFDGNPLRSLLLSARYPLGDREIVIATTHGAWGPNAANETTPLQRKRLSQIHEILGSPPRLPTLLAADFNRRCGRQDLTELQPDFLSALPKGTRTTIDPSHRAIVAGKHFEVPVDDICFTADLTCLDTVIAEGVSDHMYVEGEFRSTY